jgi:hypothetical protein
MALKYEMTAMTRFFILLLILHTSAAQAWQQPLTNTFPQDWDYNWEGTCTISHNTAFGQVDGPVKFSTSASEHLEHAKISPVPNATHWEQWEFDSLSDTGMAGMLVGFSRDASCSFFGRGNLRVEFYMAMGDGSVIQELDYVDESTVVDCGNFVKGTWNSTRRTYSFHVTKDMKHTYLSFDSPKVRGNFALTSVAPAYFADGALFPSDNLSSAELAPSAVLQSTHTGWPRRSRCHSSVKEMHPILRNGGPRPSLGQGQLVQHLRRLAHLARHGRPIQDLVLEPVSRINKGVSYYSAQLFEGDQMMLATQLGTASETEDYVLFSDEVDGGLSGKS